MRQLTYGDCNRIAVALGLSPGEWHGRDDDARGLAFTVCGGELTDGSKPPPWLGRMNGWHVEEIAKEAIERHAVERVGRYGWKAL